ncbi:MAG: 4Fe-4S dicluster domain-containing protein [Clostridiales bacterium]|nr:4Fe-4S dicluster domain-containing protein [Clostridiales bacterium]
MSHISKIILKSLFSKPSTAMYPIKKREYYPNTRGAIENDIKSCIFCGICVKKCPTKGLEVLRDQKQWSIDRCRCISCGACVTACPKKCLTMENTYSAPSTEKKVDRYIQPEDKVQ